MDRGAGNCTRRGILCKLGRLGQPYLAARKTGQDFLSDCAGSVSHSLLPGAGRHISGPLAGLAVAAAGSNIFLADMEPGDNEAVNNSVYFDQ